MSFGRLDLPWIIHKVRQETRLSTNFFPSMEVTVTCPTLSALRDVRKGDCHF
jgi:hypothetical protein